MSKNNGYSKHEPVTPFIPFWQVDAKAKIVINKQQYIKFLTDNGFWNMRIGTGELNNTIQVKIVHNIIERVDVVTIKHFVISFLNSIPTTEEGEDDAESQTFTPQLLDQVKEKLISADGTYFGSGKLDFLPVIQNKFLRDTKDSAYLFFQDQFIAITKDGVFQNDYSKLDTEDGYVWKSRVIKRKYQPGVGTISLFSKFVNNVAIINDTPKDTTSRFHHLKCLYGYMLHGYKDPSRPWVVVLTDIKINEGRAEGGTGKGLFVRSVSHVKPVVTINGQEIPPNADDRFLYQNINPDTGLLFIDDVHKKFDLASMFSSITDTLKVEKKSQHAVLYPYEDSPKTVVTTNYSLTGNSSSYKRRKKEAEFGEYYNADLTPEMDLGKILFDEFTDKEWADFYAFCIDCLQLYIINSIPDVDVVSLKLKYLINETCIEFYNFIIDLRAGKIEVGGEDPTEVYQLDGAVEKRALLTKYKEYSGDEKISARLFTKWMGLAVEAVLAKKLEWDRDNYIFTQSILSSNQKISKSATSDFTKEEEFDFSNPDDRDDEN